MSKHPYIKDLTNGFYGEEDTIEGRFKKVHELFEKKYTASTWKTVGFTGVSSVILSDWVGTVEGGSTNE